MNSNSVGVIAELFLKNIRNIPAVICAFDMLETNYISQSIFYNSINKSKMEFFGLAGKIINLIEAALDKKIPQISSTDNDKLLLMRKNIAAFNLESDQLFKAIKVKFDELVDFVSFIQEKFADLNFSLKETNRIRKEILIIKYELKNRL